MKKILAACAIAAAAVLGVSSPAHASSYGNSDGFTVDVVDPAMNKASYWAGAGYFGDDVCEKQEFRNGVTSVSLPTLSVDRAYTVVVLKAGTQYTVHENPAEGAAYSPANGKDISFAITCHDSYYGEIVLS